MPSIVFADSTGSYDGRDLEKRALGGTESSVIRMARALAAFGHDVTVFTNCQTPVTDHGVRFQPLSSAPPAACDLYVAVQHPRLLGLVRKPRSKVIWVLWQPNNLKHYKQIGRMWLHRPVPVLMSRYQASIWSPFLPRGKPPVIIPLGLPDDVRSLPPLDDVPGPNLIFASNPQRNLTDIVHMFVSRILPVRPDARLRIFGSMQPVADPWTSWGGGVIPTGLPDSVKRAISFHPAAPREELIAAFRSSRALVYLGHKVEAFCLTVAEAQACGLPCVVAPVTVLPERVIDGVTGFVRDEPVAFADAVLSLLNDDTLWQRQHEAAVARQKGISWAEAAERFEQALLN